MKIKKYKVLMWSKSSRKEKVVYKYIELKPVQNSDRLFYFLQPDNYESVTLVYLHKGIYTTHTSFKCGIEELDNPNMLKYNIELFETWINNIPTENYPSLLDIRLYKELGLDYHSLELKKEETDRKYEQEMQEIETLFQNGIEILPTHFIRLCYYKKVKISPLVLNVLGWQTRLVSIHKVYINKEATKFDKKETVKFVKKFVRNFVKKT